MWVAPALALLSAGCGSDQGGPSTTAGPDGAPPDHFTTASIRVSPALLDFGLIDSGSVSTPKTVTITMVGEVIGLVPSVLGGGFSLVGTTCTGLQEPGSTCTVTVAFAPALVGAAEGVLALNAAGIAVTVSLAGVGNAPPSFGGPDPIELGTLGVGQAVPAVVPIVPDGSTTNVACTSNSPDLSLTGQTCPVAGPVEAPCSFTFTFQAVTTGAKSDSVICTQGGKTTQTLVRATVVALEPPTITPPVGRFVATVGQTDAITLYVANVGNAPSGPLTATISAGTSVFSVVANGCAVAMPPLASCTIEVLYRPITGDDAMGTLTVVDATPGSVAATIPLTGQVAPTISQLDAGLTLDAGLDAGLAPDTALDQ